MRWEAHRTYSRRSVARAGIGATAAIGLGATAATRGMGRSGASAAVLRGPGALPSPSKPVGQGEGQPVPPAPAATTPAGS